MFVGDPKDAIHEILSDASTVIADRLFVVAGPGVDLSEHAGVRFDAGVELLQIPVSRSTAAFQAAIDAARGQVDYLLWLGSTWRIAGLTRLDKERLDADGYKLRCDDGEHASAWISVLVRCDLPWRLDADLETPVCNGRDAGDKLGGLQLVPAQSVERRAVSNAESLDRLLERIRKGPDAAAAFWLGIRYEQAGDIDSACGWFEQQVQHPSGDVVQRAIALYKLARIRQDAGVSWDRLEPAYHRAFELCPERIEPLYRIIRHYRESGMWTMALDLCEAVTEPGTPADGYDFDPAIYGFELAYERMLCASKLRRHESVLASSNKVLSFPRLPGHIRDEAIESRCGALAALKPVYPIASGRRNRINVIVPFHNAGNYLKACVASLRGQDYGNFHVYLVDDASDDGCADNLDIDCRFTLIRNDRRHGALANQCRVLAEHCESADIAVFVDGDDRLSCHDALTYINQFYNRTNCWVMYGQFETEGGGYGFARPIEPGERIDSLFEDRLFRFPIHVRTHRAGLFHRIAEQDPDLECLKDVDGRFFRGVEDMAHMRAVFQAAGPDHIFYNERVLYTYTTDNPLSNFRVAGDEQSQASKRVTAARSIEPVTTWCDAATVAMPAIERKTRLLVVTLEGMDPELLVRWSDEGHLPNLRGLLRHGTSVPLRIGSAATTTDTFWVSALTGRNPGVHGRFWPFRFAPGSYDLVWNDARIPAKAVWDVLSRAGLHSMVFNQYEMPVSREENVTCIQHWAIHAPREPVASHPDDFKDDLLSRFDTDRISVESERYKPITEAEHLALRAALRQRLDKKLGAFLHYLARGDWDLFQVGFDEAHDAGHQMWHVHDTNHAHHRPDWLEAHGDPILELYRHLDRATGRVVEAAGDAAVMILVGPGMGRTVLCGNQLDDMLLAIERHHGRPAINARPKLSDRLFFPQSFSPRVGAIRLNVVGREPAGLVRRGESYDRWCRILADHFTDLRIAGTDEPAVEKVVFVHAVCDGPMLETLPDLFVVWRVDRDIPAVESPVIGRVDIRRRENDCLSYRTGDHTENGMLVTTMSLDHAGSEPLPVEIVAPTITGFFGIEMPDAEVSGLRTADPGSLKMNGAAVSGQPFA